MMSTGPNFASAAACSASTEGDMGILLEQELEEKDVLKCILCASLLF